MQSRDRPGHARWPHCTLMAAAILTLAACTIERADVRTPSGVPPEADSTRVRKLIETFAGAFESGQLAPLDTMVHDSLTVFEAGRVERGWVTYRDGHLAPEIEMLADRRFAVRNIRIRLAGSTAWSTFAYRLSATHRDEEIDRDGVATMVFQRLAGRWRLVHLHTSSEAVPTENEPQVGPESQ